MFYKERKRHLTYVSIFFAIVVVAIVLSSCGEKKEDYSHLKKELAKTNANWQLFVDAYWIEKKKNIKSTLHQPKKLANNPLIKADSQWEENPYCFGTVIYDEESSTFKFWYQSYNNSLEKPERTPFLYATSVDGIRWNKPELDIVDFKGSKANNIMFQNYGFHDLYSPSVIKDTTDSNPEKRYKMTWWDFPLGKEGYRDDGMCIAFSPDGIHWHKYSGNPVLHVKKTVHSISDVMSVMYDSNIKKFVIYSKGWADPWPAFRQIVRTESSDFIHWSEPKPVITHAHDLKDPQSYGMTVSQFGNNYIGLLHIYHKPGNETIDIQLAMSHDNKKWKRVADQQTFIPLGEPGSWDDGMLFTAPVFNYNGKTLIYYSGWNGSHNSKEERQSGIGLAELRLNGFVSLNAVEKGTIWTKAMTDLSGSLVVNVDAAKGSLRAEVTDIDGNIIPGYSFDDCITVHSDNISAVVRWKNRVKLEKLPRFVKIKFELNNASLYGFYAGAGCKKMTK